jgi:hypothetical protein
MNASVKKIGVRALTWYNRDMLNQLIVFSLAFMFAGCNSVDNGFLNANLDEEQVVWAQKAMRDLCQESSGCCCASIDPKGDNTIIMVSELPSDYVGLQQITTEELGGYEPTIISILDIEYVTTNKIYFKALVKHELIHHCTHNWRHIGAGNIMSGTRERPQDGKLTDEDKRYVCN